MTGFDLAAARARCDAATERVAEIDLDPEFGAEVDTLLGRVVPAALAEIERLLLRIADYEHRISWDTTCGNCARLLDSSIKDYERAESTRAALDRVLALCDGNPLATLTKARVRAAAAAAAGPSQNGEPS